VTDPNKNDDVREWLGAYLDGELNAECQTWVENHLANCRQCQIELEDLRNLSNLLHADPLPVSLCSADQFLGQVIERLPEATDHSPDPVQPGMPSPTQIAQKLDLGGSKPGMPVES